MKTEGLKLATQKLGRFISRSSPTILIGLSVAGLVTTVILAVKATPKALLLIDETQEYMMGEGKKYPLVTHTKLEIVKLTWRCYLPAAAMGIVTIACIIGANSINLRRNAALASVYSLTEATLKEYQAKVVETFGESKAKKIKNEIATDQLKKNPVVDETELLLTGHGMTLCYDIISGRYFRSDIESIRKVQNELNNQLLGGDMYLSLNDLYYALGLPNIKIGDELGWVVDDGLLEFSFSSQLTPGGIPCLVLDHSLFPRYGYDIS